MRPPAIPRHLSARAQFALAALRWLPAWLTPVEPHGDALSESSLFASDDETLGDSGLALWLTQRR